MKRLLAVALLVAFGSAMAAPARLIAQWTERGDTYCKYDNGTVLNMGARNCPMSINN